MLQKFRESKDHCGGQFSKERILKASGLKRGLGVWVICRWVERRGRDFLIRGRGPTVVEDRTLGYVVSLRTTGWPTCYPFTPFRIKPGDR